MRSPDASWLCRDEEERRRLLDMEARLKPVRSAAMALLAVALLACGPWVGFWTVIPLVAAAGAFFAVDRSIHRLRRPELGIAAAWVLAQLMIAAAVPLTGGPASPALAWLALPTVTLGARFGLRGLVAGVALTAVLMIAVPLGADAAAVLAAPQLLASPLALLGGIALLSTALMRSDLEHRAGSLVDDLTGLLNRRALTGRLDVLGAQARVTGQPVAIIAGDLDHFKQVNDEHGHAVGDAVLRRVAAAMRAELRGQNSPHRVGGEEFAVVLPNCALADALAVAERLRRAVRSAFDDDADGHDGLPPVTMSFGAASGRPDTELEAVLLEADRALYDAKRAGRNRVEPRAAVAAVLPAAA